MYPGALQIFYDSCLPHYFNPQTSERISLFEKSQPQVKPGMEVVVPGDDSHSNRYDKARNIVSLFTGESIVIPGICEDGIDNIDKARAPSKKVSDVIFPARAEAPYLEDSLVFEAEPSSSKNPEVQAIKVTIPMVGRFWEDGSVPSSGSKKRNDGVRIESVRKSDTTVCKAVKKSVTPKERKQGKNSSLHKTEKVRSESTAHKKSSRHSANPHSSTSDHSKSKSKPRVARATVDDRKKLMEKLKSGKKSKEIFKMVSLRHSMMKKPKSPVKSGHSEERNKSCSGSKRKENVTKSDKVSTRTTERLSAKGEVVKQRERLVEVSDTPGLELEESIILPLTDITEEILTNECGEPYLMQDDFINDALCDPGVSDEECIKLPGKKKLLSKKTVKLSPAKRICIPDYLNPKVLADKLYVIPGLSRYSPGIVELCLRKTARRKERYYRRLARREAETKTDDAKQNSPRHSQEKHSVEGSSLKAKEFEHSVVVPKESSSANKFPKAQTSDVSKSLAVGRRAVASEVMKVKPKDPSAAVQTFESASKQFISRQMDEFEKKFLLPLIQKSNTDKE